MTSPRLQIASAIAFEGGRSLLIAAGIVVATFFLIRMVPGDVVDVLGIEGSLTYEQQGRLRQEMGLTATWLEQFALWLGMLADGDFGLSSRYAIPVVDMIATALPPTLALGLGSVAFGLAVGISLPVLAAIFPRSPFVWAVEFITIWSITVPTFSIGIACVVVLAVWLGWIPAIGNFTVPALILGTDIAGTVAKMLHEDLKEIAAADFVRTARAKGLTWNRVVLRHILPNALTVVLALSGIIVAGAITGAITMEVVFGRPGIGTLALQGIRGRDYPLIQAIIIWLGVSVILANFVTDLMQRLVDPRVRRL